MISNDVAAGRCQIIRNCDMDMDGHGEIQPMNGLV